MSTIQRTRSFLPSVVALAAAVATATTALPAHAGPRVFVVNERPDQDRGVLKLARYHGTTTAAASNAVVVTTHYEDLCKIPCGINVDTEDNPIFFFVRDGNPVSYGFRLPAEGTVTLSVKPTRKGMVLAGLMLTSFLLVPVGVPLWVAGRPKVSIADGAPSDTQAFRKLKRART